MRGHRGVVGADGRRGGLEYGRGRLDFGYKAAGIKPGGPIKLYTDFKKDLFSTAVDASGPPPLDALLQSEEFAALAARYSVLPSQVAGLRMMAGAARRSRAELATAPARPSPGARKRPSGSRTTTSSGCASG